MSFAFAAACAIAPAAARADANLELGIFAGVVAGQHVGAENPVPVNGVGAGAALEAQARINRVRVHLEGIPTVGLSAASNGAAGRSTVSLDLLNSTVLYDVDRNGRVSVGAGYQFVNLSNYNGNNGDTNFVRVSSPIYAVVIRAPLAPSRGFEATVMVDPNVRGILHVIEPDGTPLANKDEIGAEVDYALGYRWERGRFVYRTGLRGLSYHTRDAQIGDLVDRNVGGALFFDARYRFGSP